jgi:polysaccharide export outer membrane protein
MKQPLRTVCALLYAVSCCTGQATNANQKPPSVVNTVPAAPSPTPAGGTVPVSNLPPPAVTAPFAPQAAPSPGNQDTKPAAGAQQEPAPAGTAIVADPNAGKPNCETDIPPAPDSSSAKPYVIGPLDVLDIKVWENQNLSGYSDVGPDGMISLPLIGQVKADGLTQAELTKVIRDRLASSVTVCPPHVNVQVVRVNSKKFYIYGGVFRQGEFPLTTEMTVMDAFANCGGFKDFANLKKIYIMRGTKKFDFNYKDVSHGKNISQDIKLQNGDRIFVPE